MPEQCPICEQIIEESCSPKITEFYNHCHGKGGKFCSTGGGSGESEGSSNESKGTESGVSGKISSPLKDSDGSGTTEKGSVKRGARGASLVDPSVGTKTIDGVKGYDAKGKPVPGTDAWLEAHGISRQVFESRPYVKYEADSKDAALKEAYRNYPKAEKFFLQRAENEGQHGGYIMYKHAAPKSPHGEVAPQARPNAPIITDLSKYSYQKKALENDKARLETLKKATPAALKAEARAQLKQAKINLERTKTATPEKVRAEAQKAVDDAIKARDKAKASGDPEKLFAAKKAVVDAKRAQIKDNRRADRWFPEKELYDANLAVKNAENRLQKVTDNPQKFLADQIKSQERRVKRTENRFSKTAAKYVFPPGTSSARIDVNNDPQNIRNLVNGKGRIYFAMEGAIKADAILTAAKKEDPTAAVVNVPSVTLWQQKSALAGGQGGGVASSEVKWFAKTYGKNREIILIPDADGVTNPNVMMQAKALSTALKASGAGHVIVAAPPLKYGTKKVVDHFNLPSGVDEGRKGIDDHLGGGRGQLSQLQYSTTVKYPKYDLSEFAKNTGTGTGAKVNKNAIPNLETTLAAISGIAGPEGVTRMPKKMLAQTASLPKTSALNARDKLAELGLIKVEHIFDPQALSRGKKIRNPEVSDDRVNELVKRGIIKEPRTDDPYTDIDIELSPVITILDKRFVVSPENVQTGSLADLATWSPPKNYKGWTSPITGKKDNTGLAEKLVQNTVRSTAKKESTRVKFKTAPPGRRIVRTQAGARKYGVAIGDLIPLGADTVELDTEGIASEVMVSMVLVPDSVTTEEELIEFYNHCHGKGGKFCSTGGESKSTGSGKGVTGKTSNKISWPPTKGRQISVVAKAGLGGLGHVTVDGIKAKTVYEITDNNGKKIRLYDKTGKVGSYYKDLLNNHARMNELYKLSPPRGIIVTKPGKGLNENDFSSVNSNNTHTLVNVNALGFDIRTIRQGYLMPSAHTGNTKNMDYLMTHEYGHQVDFSRHVTGDTHTATALWSDPAFKNSLSTYGQKSPVEGYAEAFAEWNYSRGRTTNPAAIALARQEGWYGIEGLSLAASGKSNFVSASGNIDSEDLDIISMVNYNLISFNEGDLLSFEIVQEFQDSEDDSIYDDLPSNDSGVTVTDGFEKGSKVTGSEKMASDSEVAKATQLMKDVCNELELDYESIAKGKE
jgi:hypothetical protein